MKNYKDFITEAKSLNVLDIPANVQFKNVEDEVRVLTTMILSKAKKNKKDARTLNDIIQDVEDAQKAFKK